MNVDAIYAAMERIQRVMKEEVNGTPEGVIRARRQLTEMQQFLENALAAVHNALQSLDGITSIPTGTAVAIQADVEAVRKELQP